MCGLWGFLLVGAHYSIIIRSLWGYLHYIVMLLLILMSLIIKTILMTVKLLLFVLILLSSSLLLLLLLLFLIINHVLIRVCKYRDIYPDLKDKFSQKWKFTHYLLSSPTCGWKIIQSFVVHKHFWSFTEKSALLWLIFSCFSFFYILDGPCQPSSFKLCSGDIIFLWKQLVYSFIEKDTCFLVCIMISLIL